MERSFGDEGICEAQGVAAPALGESVDSIASSKRHRQLDWALQIALVTAVLVYFHLFAAQCPAGPCIASRRYSILSSSVHSSAKIVNYLDRGNDFPVYVKKLQKGLGGFDWAYCWAIAVRMMRGRAIK
jgi:hypothetical protein